MRKNTHPSVTPDRSPCGRFFFGASSPRPLLRRASTLFAPSLSRKQAVAVLGTIIQSILLVFCMLPLLAPCALLYTAPAICICCHAWPPCSALLLPHESAAMRLAPRTPRHASAVPGAQRLAPCHGRPAGEHQQVEIAV